MSSASRSHTTNLSPDNPLAVDVRDLSHWYDETAPPALSDVDFSVDKGSFTCIIGPSGCGKSTLLSILGGLIKPDTGTVKVAGSTIVDEGRYVAKEPPPIGYVFQDHRLLPWRTVSENIEIVLRAAKVPHSEWNEIISRYLTMLRIGGYHKSWPLQLSGGQRQRAAIARALAIHPEVMLMDEPFSTLDEVTARFLRRELIELWQRLNPTVIFVTHSVREAVYLADEVIIFTNGPGRVAKRVPIILPRPRSPEDPELAIIEAGLVEDVLSIWGQAVDDAEDYG